MSVNIAISQPNSNPSALIREWHSYEERNSPLVISDQTIDQRMWDHKRWEWEGLVVSPTGRPVRAQVSSRLLHQFRGVVVQQRQVLRRSKVLETFPKFWSDCDEDWSEPEREWIREITRSDSSLVEHSARARGHYSMHVLFWTQPACVVEMWNM